VQLFELLTPAGGSLPDAGTSGVSSPR
jgi:hypothetical protein